MLKYFLNALTLIGLMSYAQAAEPTPASHLAETEQTSSCKKTDSFAVQVFAELSDAQEGNFVFSPASLEGVLRLLQQGARGTTAEELDNLPMGQPNVRTAMNPAEANALFISTRMELKPGINADTVVKTPFAESPTEAAKIINTWANDNTRGLIPSIVEASDIHPITDLVAANAIYLKEKWLHPFSKKSTHENAEFTLENGTTTRVAMMRNKAKYRYAEGEDWTAVALPYDTEGREGEPGYFIGILPKAGARDFARELTPQKYQAIREALVKNRIRDTTVYLPRFELNPGTYSLKAALRTCGLDNILTPQANFSGFSDRPLYLSDVLQRCYVKADEEGTEAAAVTVSVLRTTSFNPRPQVIRFDRPFVWVIGDLNTPAAPYFMGITQKP